jgi:hypothetical protein
MDWIPPANELERLEHYVAKAKEADAKAAGAGDPQVRTTWTQIAQSWRLMADHLAREIARDK